MRIDESSEIFRFSIFSVSLTMAENVFLQIWQMFGTIVALVTLEVGREQLLRLCGPDVERNFAGFRQILQHVGGIDEVPEKKKKHNNC
jgi:hypothetical protein